MTVIDYDTCGINEVIAHSLELHPQLLADRLRSPARVHAEFADAYNDREVTGNELALADRLEAFANAIEQGDTVIPSDDNVRCETFGCAAWLQDLHPIMQGRSSSEKMRGTRVRAGAAETAAARTMASRRH